MGLESTREKFKIIKFDGCFVKSVECEKYKSLHDYTLMLKFNRP